MGRNHAEMRLRAMTALKHTNWVAGDEGMFVPDYLHEDRGKLIDCLKNENCTPDIHTIVRVEGFRE